MSLRYHLLVIFFVLGIWSVDAISETRIVYGLPLHVDSIVSLDTRHVKIIVFGEPTIVSPDAVDSFLASAYINRDDFVTRFTSSEVQKSIEVMLHGKSFKLAAEAMYQYLRAATVSLEEKIAFLREFSSEKNAVTVFRAVLEKEHERELGLPALFIDVFIGMEDESWVRTHQFQRIVIEREAFFSVVRQFLQDELLLSEGKVRTRSLLSLLERLFGKGDPEVQSMFLLAKRMLALASIEVSLDRSKLYSYAGGGGGDANYAVLRPLVVQKIHEFSDFAIRQKKPSSALILLSELLPGERSERTQALIVRAVELLGGEKQEVQQNRIVRELLEEESRNNEMVRRGYVTYLRKIFESEVQSGHLRSASLVREQLRILSLQEQDQYDQMIFQEALVWAARGRRDVTDELLALRSHNVEPLEFVALYSAGYYGSPTMILLLSLIPVLLLALLVVRQREKRVYEAESHSPLHTLREDDGVEEGQREHHARVFSSLGGGGNPQLLEYKKLVEGLGLPWQATIVEIKVAYRKGIKEVHPDKLENIGGKTSDEFIHLSQRYERILELRSKLAIFGEDER